ncbi:MAG: mechanosensitive ion channel family protein, partial [Nocardioidaceae bacterium]
MATSACPDESDDLCRYVERVTGSEWLARASDWLIAKPAAILTLILIGIITRWIIHRAIDRLTHRAAEGTVPGVIARGKVPQMFLEHQASAAERRQQRAQTMGGLLKSIT